MTTSAGAASRGSRQEAQKYGLQVVAEERYTRGDLDFTSQLSRIKASGTDFMVDWSRYAEGALIIKQMKQMGINIPYFGSDGQAHPKFRELGASAAEGAYYPTHFSVTAIGDNKVAQDFTAKTRAAYNKDPGLRPRPGLRRDDGNHHGDSEEGWRGRQNQGP